MKNNFFGQTPVSLHLLFGGMVFVLVAFAGGMFYAWWQRPLIFPENFKIGDVPVAGLSLAAATRAVNNAFNQHLTTTLAVVKTNSAVICSLPLTVEGQPIVELQRSATMARAARQARRDLLLAWRQKLFGGTSASNVGLVVNMTPRAQQLIQLASQPCFAGNGSRDASFKPVVTNTGVRLEVVPAVAGENFDYEQLWELLPTALSYLQQKNSLLISTTETEPLISSAVANTLLPQAQALVPATSRTITFAKQQTVLVPVDLAAAIQPILVNGEAAVGIEENNLRRALANFVEKIEQPAADAIVETSSTPDGHTRVTRFVPAQAGVGVDWSTTTAALQQSLLDGQRTVALTTTSTQPAVTLEKANELGITELIGVGRSNFAGSPANRRHNIKNGSKKLDGIIIAPDETFSLITALGKIDGSTGYLEELVIKENETKPEFGGGLCQVGTTMFRAALGAGLPIVERRNHSYQVSYYYENGVSGTDATIYDPKPDLRFLNDTGNNILIHTIVNNNELVFEFWGKADGRRATRTIPKISNITSPPPKKEVPTTDIPVGTVKCTEKPHAGADAIFSYTVEYPSGEIKKTDFTSHYKPWGEVCLVGVAATSTEPLVAPTGEITPDAAGVTGN